MGLGLGRIPTAKLFIFLYRNLFFFLLYFLITHFKKTPWFGEFGERRSLLGWGMAAGNGMIISRLDV